MLNVQHTFFFYPLIIKMTIVKFCLPDLPLYSALNCDANRILQLVCLILQLSNGLADYHFFDNMEPKHLKISSFFKAKFFEVNA